MSKDLKPKKERGARGAKGSRGRRPKITALWESCPAQGRAAPEKPGVVDLGCTQVHLIYMAKS